MCPKIRLDRWKFFRWGTKQALICRMNWQTRSGLLGSERHTSFFFRFFFISLMYVPPSTNEERISRERIASCFMIMPFCFNFACRSYAMLCTGMWDLPCVAIRLESRKGSSHRCLGVAVVAHQLLVSRKRRDRLVASRPGEDDARAPRVYEFSCAIRTIIKRLLHYYTNIIKKIQSVL